MAKELARLLALSLSAAIVVSAQAERSRKDIPTIAKAANGSIVSIVMSDDKAKPIAQGTGFVVTKDGLILTNYHVIAEGNSAVAKMPDGAIYVLEGAVAWDRARDIALVKAIGKNFKALSLGNSNHVEVGQEVVAIGNPLSLESTVSNGIISGIRDEEELGGKFLQVTAPISPGSSGGPLFDMTGEVIGITTLYLKGGENLNFAIPINDATQMIANPCRQQDLPPIPPGYTLDCGKLHPVWPNEPKAKEEAKESVPSMSHRFPENNVQSLRAAGNLPTWANYVCWDTTPGLQDSWFLLLAYSQKFADPDAVRAGVLKAVTFQEYLSSEGGLPDTLINPPPATTVQVAQTLNGMKAGDKISESIIEIANQEVLAVENAKRLAGVSGVDFEGLMKARGMARLLYFMQKYVNATKPESLFGIRLADTDFRQGAELGTILYETAPQSNVFRTKNIESDKEDKNVASIVVQPSSDSIRFTFVRSIDGEMSLPISGMCKIVRRE